jgi:hypothetical protein
LSRGTYAALIVLVTLAGLATLTRALRVRWPVAMDKAGDGLWATLVFLVISFVLPGVALRWRALLALGIACAVEFSQLYRAPWIDGIRSHFLGRLFLGMGFDAFDLISYSVGVALGVALCVVASATASAARSRSARG